jgi:hypothetical protein
MQAYRIVGQVCAERPRPFWVRIANDDPVLYITCNVTITVKPLPTVTMAFPESATVSPGPTVPVPVGKGLVYQVFGGMNYNRLIDIDRVNGFFIGQTNQTSTGIFPIDRAGPYSITVTGANGCQRTVTGTIVGK